MKLELPQITIKTELGDIRAELYVEQAPLTVKNFLSYIKIKAYTNSSFYRTVRHDNQAENPLPLTVPIEVIQGGLGMDDHPLRQVAITLETTQTTALSHLDGSLSMGRLEPDSASSEFFICINDQADLDYGGKRNPDGQGFAVFGRVTKGMDIVKQIQASPATGQWLEPSIRIDSIDLS